MDVPVAQRPQTNLTGIFPGPLNANAYVPFTAPANQSVIGAGGQGVLLLPSLNKSFTPSVAPAPVNLTSKGQMVPASVNPNITVGSSASAASAKPSSAAAPLSVRGVVAVLTAILAAGALLV
jgi:hypothetical protein